MMCSICGKEIVSENNEGWHGKLKGEKVAHAICILLNLDNCFDSKTEVEELQEKEKL